MRDLKETTDESSLKTLQAERISLTEEVRTYEMAVEVRESVVEKREIRRQKRDEVSSGHTRGQQVEEPEDEVEQPEDQVLNQTEEWSSRSVPPTLKKTEHVPSGRENTTPPEVTRPTKQDVIPPDTGSTSQQEVPSYKKTQQQTLVEAVPVHYEDIEELQMEDLVKPKTSSTSKEVTAPKKPKEVAIPLEHDTPQVPTQTTASPPKKEVMITREMEEICAGLEDAVPLEKPTPVSADESFEEELHPATGSIPASTEVSCPAPIRIPPPERAVYLEKDISPPKEAVLPTEKTSPKRPKASPEEVPPQKKPVTKPEVAPSQTPAVPPQKKPVTKPEVAPSQTPEVPPQKKPVTKPEVAPSQTPAVPPQKKPVTKPEVAPMPPQKKPVTKPEVAPSQTPAVPPQKKPVTKPEVAPSQTPEVPPQKKPVTKPEVAPSQTAEVPPQKKPVTTPEKKPVTKPEVAPSQTPAVPPQKKPVTKPEVAPSQTAAVPPQKKPVTKPEVAPSQTPAVPPQKKPVTKPEVAPSQTPAEPPQKKEPPVPEEEALVVETAASLAHTVFSPELDSAQEVRSSPREGDEKAKKSKEQSLQTASPPEDGKPAAPKSSPPAGSLCEAHESVSSSRLRQRTGNQLQLQLRHRSVLLLQCLVRRKRKRLHRKLQLLQLKPLLVQRKRKRLHQRLQQIFNQVGLLVAQVSPVAKTPSPAGVRASPAASPPEDKGPVSAPGPTTDDMLSPLFVNVFTASTTVTALKHKGKIPVQETKTPESPTLKSRVLRGPKEKEPEVVTLKKVLVKPPEPEKQVVTHKAEVTKLQDVELVVHGLHERDDREIITLGRTERVFTAEEQTAQLGHFEEAERVTVTVKTTEQVGWTRTPKSQKEEEPEVPKAEKKKITKLPKADEKTDSTKLKPFEKSGTPEEEPQRIQLKKVPTKPKEPEKEVITQRCEVTRHYDSELSVQKLRHREDRELLTVVRPERVFTAAEDSPDSGHMEEPEELETEDEKSRWTRTPKAPEEEEPEPDFSKKKIKKLPKKDEEQEAVTLKPFERPKKPEAPEPAKSTEEAEAKTDTERTPYKRVETPQRGQPAAAIKHSEDQPAHSSPEVPADVGKDQVMLKPFTKPKEKPEEASEALKPKGKIPVQETKTPESPTLKSRVLRGPKEKEPEVVTLKKVLVKPPEPEKQVVTHKAEVTKLQDVELVVHGLHERDDREIITLGRTERVFTAEEQTAQLGHFEEAERVTVTVKTTEQVGWTRTPKSQKEEEPEVPKAEKKKITKLPKADEKKDSTKLKPFEKSGTPEEEPQRIQLKKVPTKPKEPEKEVITQRCEVTRHYDSELSVQKLRHREDRELLTVVRPERVFTAAEDSPDSGHMEEPEELETEDEKSRWTRTPKAPEEEEPEPDFSKKKIKKLPKKDEEQEAVTLKPFERPKKPEAPEPAKSTEEAEAKTDTERTPYKRVETPQRGQPAAAIRHSEDQPAHSSPEVPADVGKDQVLLKPFTKPKEKPEKKKAVDTKVPRLAPSEEAPKDLKKVEKTADPQEDDEEEEAAPDRKASPPGKKDTPQKQADILKKAVELKKTHSPRAGKDKVDEDKAVKAIEQLKKAELRKTPSPRVETTISPKDSVEAVTLKKTPRKSPPEEAPGRGRIPLGKEVSPGAVQMQKDWEGEAVDGERQTPGMPGARRGTGTWKRHFSIPVPTPIILSSVNIYSIFFILFISMENRQRRRQRAEAEDSGLLIFCPKLFLPRQTPSPGDAGRGRGLKTGGRGPTPPEDPFGGFKLKAVPLKFVKKIKDILLLEAESIGSSAVFECEVTPSTAITTWMKDGTNLREGPKHKFTADGKDRKLNIIDVQLSDTGDYTCVAKNAGKEITCTAKLVVEELPVKWVKDLDPETSCIKSQPMYLTCELNKEREVVWKRNGALLKKKAGKVAINIIGMQHAITIQNAMEEDSGSYTCEVEGQEDVKTTGIVKVIGKQFRGGTANSSVASGEEANTTFKPVHHQELQLDQFYISPPSGGEANTTFKPVHLQELQLDQFYTSPPSGATVRPVLHQSTIRSYIHLQELQLDQFYTSPPSGGEANSTFKPVPHQELQLDQFYTSPPSGGEANTTFKPVHHQELQLDQFNTSPPSGATELQLDQFYTSPPSGGEANTTFKPVHHQELQLDQFNTSPPSGATELQLDQFNTSPPSGGEANTTFKPVHHQELQLDQFYTSPPSGATELQLDQFNTSPPSGGEANTTFKPVHHQELQLDQFNTSPPSGATELQLDQFYTSPPPGGDANSSVGDDKVIKDWLVKPLRDQHVKPRAKATFKCELFKDTPNWKWFKGDTELAPSDKIQIEKDGQIVTLTVDNCQADDVSDYIIAVEDRRYSAKLTLGEREAEVLKPLVSQEVVEKEEANFDTEISEQDVVGEWKLRGQVLMRSPTCDIKSDGKKRFLTLKQVQLDQAGEVSYQALNAVTTAMLTVTEIEMGFVEPLKDVSVPERKQAKFECTVTKEVSKVLWFRGADIVTPSPKHEIMGDGRKHMLIINSCEFDDEAQYTVEVLGQRCSALLAVEGMRLKLVQPLKDRTAKEGQTVRFELELSHDNVPVVWYRNEVKLHVSRTVLTHVEGKRHVLEMRTLCLDDTCQIKAEAKGIHSTAKLTVIAPPCCISSSSVSGSISGALIFIHLWVHLWGSHLHPSLGPPLGLSSSSISGGAHLHPSLGGFIFIHLWGLQDYTATEKDEVSLDCELSKDVPVMWFHEETEVIASKTLLMKSEGTRRSLVLRKVEQSDKGKYVCDCGTDKTTASINIEARDIKVVRPIYGVELFDGETARFEVEISEDDVRGQWKLNGDVLTPSSDVDIIEEGGKHTLILYNCKVAMTGEVAYSAANAKCAANLKVKELPMNFLTPLSDVNVYEKDEARFELELSRAAKSFRWLKGTQELQKDEKYEMIQEGNMYVLQIRSVAYEDEAKYMFEAEDKRTSGKLVIQGIRLEFAKPIKDVTVKERETAEFSVELSHDKVPVVWYKNDVRLHPSKVVHMSDHGKVHTLAFKEVTIDDTSMIKVEAMDKSVTAMLTVIEGDLYFTTKLQNYTAVEKDEVKLICELSKTTADVKWFKDGKEITPSKNIAVSTDGKKRILMVRKAEKANIGEYSCDCGSDKTAANLNIEERDIKVTRPLYSVEVTETETAKFETEISEEDVHGNWKLKGEALHQSADVEMKEEGTKHLLILYNVKMDMAGGVDFSAANAKSNAQLRVKARSIGLLRPLKDVTVTAGETATFESELSYEGIAVDWFLCGKKMEASERVKTRVAGKVHTLTLRDVMQSEAGEVKMTSKDFKTAAQLIVRQPAVEFSRPLEDQSVEEEAAARLECEVSREEAEVRWFREGQEVRKTKKYDVISEGRKRALVILDCTPDDAKMYTCDAGDFKTSCFLEVMPPHVEFVKPLQDVEVKEKETARFECEVSRESAKVRWFKDGSEIRKGKKYEIVSKGVSRILIVHKAAFDDEAEYECDARTAKSCGMLTVIEEAARFTKNLSNVEGTETDSVKMICEVSKPSAEVRWFRGDEELPEGGRYEHIVDGKRRILIVQDLRMEDGGEYSCRLSATVKTSAKLSLSGMYIHHYPESGPHTGIRFSPHWGGPQGSLGGRGPHGSLGGARSTWLTGGGEVHMAHWGGARSTWLTGGARSTWLTGGGRGPHGSLGGRGPHGSLGGGEVHRAHWGGEVHMAHWGGEVHMAHWGGRGPQGSLGGRGPQGSLGGRGPQGSLGGRGPQGSLGGARSTGLTWGGDVHRAHWGGEVHRAHWGGRGPQAHWGGEVHMAHWGGSSHGSLGGGEVHMAHWGGRGPHGSLGGERSTWLTGGGEVHMAHWGARSTWLTGGARSTWLTGGGEVHMAHWGGEVHMAHWGGASPQGSLGGARSTGLTGGGEVHRAHWGGRSTWLTGGGRGPAGGSLGGRGHRLRGGNQEAVEGEKAESAALFLKTRTRAAREGRGSVRGHIGGVKASAELTVIEKLRVITPIKDTQVKEGGEIVFNCETNTEGAKAKWLKNAETIFESSKYTMAQRDNVFSLRIREASKKDEAVYTISLTNQRAEQAKCSARAAVGEAAVPGTPSRTLRLRRRRRSAFTCKVNRPEVTVRWLKAGQEVTLSKRIVYRADGLKHTLTVKDCVMDDEGEYTAVVGDDNSETTTITEFEDAEFTCKMSKEKAAVKWYRNGREIREGPRYHMEREGKTCRLVIKVCRPDDECEYACGVDEKRTRARLFRTPVEIIRPPQDTFQPPGSDVVFEVELNKDRVEVKWMRNNMIIVQGDKYQMISEGKIHRLQVCEIRPRDQGEYRLVAKDKDARAKLELAAIPKIKTTDQNLVTDARKPFMMTVPYDAYPRADTEWFHEGTSLPVQTHRHLGRQDGVPHEEPPQGGPRPIPDPDPQQA
ncbi:hypothetical protein KUCAC02_022144 [Chaenocephalus aceratus]|nr:hypothetical protein KUCAC02_022144 [Chaenocephalus aceratus]